MKKGTKKVSPGDKVVFIPEGKVYDFGYTGVTGKAIIYEEGERNMQDSYAVDIKNLEFASDRDKRREAVASRRGLDYPGLTICYVCHDGNGNYLMNKRSPNCSDEHGTWDFGGGRVEHGDSVDKTVIKELQEEYCVKPLSVSFLGYYDLFRKSERGPRHWLCMIFLVEVDRTLVKNGEPHKFDDLQWFKLDALPSPLHPLAPIEVDMIRKLRQ